MARWDQANQVAAVVSALAAVAALGVAVWSALPSSAGAVRVSKTGTATAQGAGSGKQRVHWFPVDEWTGGGGPLG
ncbi:hypothetical protein [Micromonospora deserti]|uniref:hypothetical protein n=1 Tax=Micromonospora deserti TaxID=2070366 RepID=UPI0018F641C1|nr:hypothetical protein [Micromonospora deserti]